MSRTIKIIASITAFLWLTGSVSANHHMLGNWDLSADESKVSFGSLKKGKVGEVHHFKTISGKISPKGEVTVTIDASSVETWIDIRNERMVKWVFDAASPNITLSAKVNPMELTSLKPGDTKTIEINGVLEMSGKTINVETEMFVAPLSENKVLVTTNEMIMLSMEDAGINDGITKLMEIAKLPSIERASPVTLRFVFVKP